MEQLPRSPDLLQEYLKGLFEYREGRLYWRRSVHPYRKRVAAGTRAGSQDSKGYRTIKIGGKIIGEHRIIWIIHNGLIPTGFDIDHRDCIPSHNQINNLRLCTDSENQCNASKRKDNTSGYKGVSYIQSEAKWRALVTKNKKRYFLGYYTTPKEAHEAYKQAAIKLHGEYAKY